MVLRSSLDEAGPMSRGYPVRAKKMRSASLLGAQRRNTSHHERTAALIDAYYDK